MRIFLLSICCLLVCGQTVFAQKFIQMDMFGKKKAMRFSVGDELRFKVKGDDKFYVLPIVDLDEKTGKITLPKGEVFLHEITVIQVLRWTESRSLLGSQLLAFGGVFALAAVVVGSVVFVAGALLRWAFKKRNFKINQRRQLRILNLNIEDLA